MSGVRVPLRPLVVRPCRPKSSHPECVWSNSWLESEGGLCHDRRSPFSYPPADLSVVDGSDRDIRRVDVWLAVDRGAFGRHVARASHRHPKCLVVSRSVHQIRCHGRYRGGRRSISLRLAETPTSYRSGGIVLDGTDVMDARLGNQTRTWRLDVGGIRNGGPPRCEGGVGPRDRMRRIRGSLPCGERSPRRAIR